MPNTLKNKRVLITSGPTWVPLDSVRIISNIATGETGIRLAQEAQKRGARVTLVLGPIVNTVFLKKIRVIRFTYFSELYQTLKKELTARKYDAVIHTAAVSDFKPKKFVFGKLKSKKQYLRLELESTIKIVDRLKAFSKDIFLIAFKLEFVKSKQVLIKRAAQLMRQARADMVVANSFHGMSYRALIIDKAQKTIGTARSKQALIQSLLRILEEKL
ncbi:phosphopantothenoylcysteine decarboxylase [Candidatus Omnitrophota bacterium]